MDGLTLGLEGKSMFSFPSLWSYLFPVEASRGESQHRHLIQERAISRGTSQPIDHEGLDCGMQDMSLPFLSATFAIHFAEQQ
jgi:hypothetical protein